jgi:hypothetical protein
MLSLHFAHALQTPRQHFSTLCGPQCEMVSSRSSGESRLLIEKILVTTGKMKSHKRLTLLVAICMRSFALLALALFAVAADAAPLTMGEKRATDAHTVPIPPRWLAHLDLDRSYSARVHVDTLGTVVYPAV